jgi:hypothetical protein
MEKKGLGAGSAAAFACGALAPRQADRVVQDFLLPALRYFADVAYEAANALVL